MSTDRDTARIVRSWLRMDEHESADRVLDAVLDQLDTTPQRRATWWPAWRNQTNSSTVMPFGIAAATLLVLVFIGLQLLPGGGNLGGTNATAEPSPSPTPTASTSPTPTATDTWVPGAALDEGRNELVLGDVRLSIEVPRGWQTMQFEGMIRHTTPSGGHWPWIAFLQTFDRVADDPCAASATPVGPTVDDFANGLMTIPGTVATEPFDTTIGGVPAKYVELTINDDIGCPATSFWLYGPDSAWPNSILTIVRVWVLELDGTRYVIHSDQVGDDPDVAAMIVDVVESIEFEPAP